MIKIENLNKFYSNNDVVSKGLENINITFNKGEFVAICGESGSGKSTLLNVITFMDSYDEGEIYFNGDETSYFNEDDISEFKKSHVSFIFQNYNLLDSYTVLENVMLPLIIKGVPFKEAKEKAKVLIEKVGLTKRINNKGSHLSGGEKQRVSIARALASDAEILACDEPTGNLDSENRNEIVKLIKEVCKDKLVLYVTHNYEEIKDVCTRTIYLKDGHIIKDIVNEGIVGEKKEVKNDFNYKKISNKSLFLLALKNIFSTPKKNFLIFFILFIMSMMFSLIFNNAIDSVTKESSMNVSNSYIIDENYALYKKSDNLNLKGETFENASLLRANFYEDNYNLTCAYTPFDIKCDLFYGDLINDNDLDSCNIYLPLEDQNIIKKNVENVKFVIDFNEYSFNVSGIGYSNKIKGMLVNFNYENNSQLKSDLYKKSLSQILTYNDSTPGLFKPVFDDSNLIVNSKPKAYLTIEEAINFKVSYLEKNITDQFEVEIVSYPYNKKFDISYDFIDSLEEDSAFYASSKAEFNENINELKSKNVHFYIPGFDREPNKLVRLGIVLTLLSLICPFILFFVLTKLILNRVYSSKIKDYSIVRILGVNFSDMKKMVMVESFIFTFCSMILGYFSIINIIKLIPFLRYSSFAQFNGIAFTIYIFVVLLFSYLLSVSFSKLLYKNSSMKTLKEEAL